MGGESETDRGHHHDRAESSAGGEGQLTPIRESSPVPPSEERDDDDAQNHLDLSQTLLPFLLYHRLDRDDGADNSVCEISTARVDQGVLRVDIEEDL
jgi:hypothetical protein